MIGVLLISIGTTIRAIYTAFEVFMESHYFSPAALLIAIGIIIFFVALFGCVGAIRGSVCLINLVKQSAYFPSYLANEMRIFTVCGSAVSAPDFGAIRFHSRLRHEDRYQRESRV